MFTGFITIIHVLVALALILIILLQTGKGAGMGAAFGGSSQTLFGSTGRATFLSKITVAAAIIFTVTSLILSLVQGGSRGVMKGYENNTPAASEVPSLPPSSQQPGAGAPDATALPPAGGAEGVPGLPTGEPAAPASPAPGAPGAAPTGAPEPSAPPPAAPAGSPGPTAPANPAPIAPPPASPTPSPAAPAPNPGQ